MEKGERVCEKEFGEESFSNNKNKTVNSWEVKF